MKKFLLFAFAVATMYTATSQTTIFSENFSTGIPGTWTLINNDGHTPASQVSFVNAAWIWDNNQYIGQCALSTSWYSPAAASDDWLITPSIIIPSGSTNVLLLWDATAASSQYADGYELKIATNHGNTISDFTTTLFSVAHEHAYWNTRSLDLSSYAGDTITLAWRNNSNDMELLAVDNIKIKSNVPNYNLQHTAFDSYIYMRPNESNQLTGDIYNLGFQTVTGFKLNYSTNGSSTVSATINGISIPPYTSYHYTYPNNFSPSSVGGYNLKMWASDINGSFADSDHSNDSLTRFIQAISNNVNKRPVMEEFTGAWCGYCPDGNLKLAGAVSGLPALIPVSIHSQNGGGASADKMNCTEGETRVNTYSIGFPSGILDAVYYLDESDVAFDRISTSWTDNSWLDKANFRMPMASPANVSLVNKTYNTGTRQLSVTVRADFLANVTGDYRLNLYLTEDSIVGSGAGYDQHNYFSNSSSGGSAWSGSPYASLADPVVGWAHNHVLRKAIGGAWGDAGIIPSTVTSGSNYTKTYSYILPQTWRENYVSLVGIVEEYNSDYKYRNILNAEEAKLTGTVGIEPVNRDNFASVSVYPNPASNLLKIGFELKENSTLIAFVTNALGQKIADIYNGDVNTGEHTLSWYTENVANGIYFVTLKTETSEITRRFVVNK